MEHVHEPSDDSYCTTDEGNSRKDDGEEPYSPISDDKLGEEIKLNEDKVVKIIEKYIELLKAKDFKLSSDLEILRNLEDLNEKKFKIDSLLEEKSEARIFEIISYAILKNHYKNQHIYKYFL